MIIHFVDLIISAMDCGSPDIPTNGDALFISTVFGAIVMHTCDDMYALCGNETRMCLANGMWSGEVPECISK